MGFHKWRKKFRKGVHRRYYLQKPKEDTRSVFGKKLDLLGSLLLVWLVSFFLLAGLTGQPLTALVLSIPLMAAGALPLKKLREQRERRRLFRQRIWLAGQKFMEDISKISEKEFQPYVQNILATLPGFQDVKPHKAKNSRGNHERGLDLVGIYKGVPIAVRCIRPKGEEKIGPEEIRAFVGALHLDGYKSGLFITLGSFEAEGRLVVNEAARKGINIRLVNRYGLTDLARRAGSGVFQGEKEVGGVPAQSKGKERNAVLNAFVNAAFGSRKKAKAYFLYGLLLYGGYALLNGSTKLSWIYLFFAALNFILAAGSLFFGGAPEETDPLEGLGAEK